MLCNVYKVGNFFFLHFSVRKRSTRNLKKKAQRVFDDFAEYDTIDFKDSVLNFTTQVTLKKENFNREVIRRAVTDVRFLKNRELATG